MTEWLRRLSRPIGELVQRTAVTGSEAEPLFGLLARMREAGEAAALITDRDGRIAGMLTAEDLIERALFTLEPDRPVAAVLRRVPALHDQSRMRGWSPPKHGMPTAAQRCDVEIAQPRNLDIKGVSVGQRRTNPDPPHRNQASWRVLPPAI